jgi:hypothetical protein
MRDTAAKKRSRQEDMDSDYLFGDFLQFPAFAPATFQYPLG